MPHFSIMGKKESYVDVACKVADAMVQEREEWIASAEHTLREDGFGDDSRRLAEEHWVRVHYPRPATGPVYPNFAAYLKEEGLL